MVAGFVVVVVLLIEVRVVLVMVMVMVVVVVVKSPFVAPSNPSFATSTNLGEVGVGKG